MIGPSIRVLAMMEAYSVTGPAKNLIEFSRRASRPIVGPPRTQVSIVTFQRPSDSSPNAFIVGARTAGLDVDVIHERWAFDVGVIPQLLAVVSERQPHIIQSHNIKSHFLVRYTGLNRRYPWIAFQHGYTATNTKMLLYNQLDRWSLRAADRVVTVCGPFAAALARTGVRPERIVVRHNAVEPFVPAPEAEVARLRAALGIPKGALVVLCAGRLSKEKGHADLIRAIAVVAQGRGTPPFRLVVAGGGPERGSIERTCAALGLVENVILTGYQPDLRVYYQMADMVALSSHTEGSPNVLLEAMAAGLPVVATRVGGVPEIAGHEENALLVEPRDPEAMAAALVRLLRDEDLRKRLGAAARIVTFKYTPEAYFRGLLDIYRQVLSLRGKK
ncbi:MAG: glycosyltransferase family 4 protein [Bryobacteraceae bacterium]